MIMEQKPSTEIVSTPAHEVITSLGKIQCHWVNTTLMRFEDPYEDHIEYNDGERLHKLNILEDDWDKLIKDDYPWEYWPDMSRFDDEDKIMVTAGAHTYEFRPRNTKLMLFKDHSFDHVEHRPKPNTTKGITITDDLKEVLFRGDFPIKFLPYIDRPTREYFDSIRGVK